jgi:hypothetical protein
MNEEKANLTNPFSAGSKVFVAMSRISQINGFTCCREIGKLRSQYHTWTVSALIQDLFGGNCEAAAREFLGRFVEFSGPTVRLL